MTRLVKRQTKIARTLIRLKHSLAADDEIADELEKMKALIADGQIPQLDAALDELVNE